MYQRNCFLNHVSERKMKKKSYMKVRKWMSVLKIYSQKLIFYSIRWRQNVTELKSFFLQALYVQAK